MVRCRLSELLGKKRMHIRELARISGISYPTLWSLYHEKTTRVDLKTLEQICIALGCEIGDLLYIEVEEKSKKEKPKKGGK